MPRVPSYQPGQIGPVEVTGARFRAADGNGGIAGGLADGLAGLGKATMQYARVQDDINAKNDDTQARKMAAEAGVKINALTQQYRGLMGANAREKQADTIKQIEALRDEYLGQAGNGRMRMMLKERLTGLYSSSSAQISEHAFKESQAERASAFKGEQLMYSEMAATTDDPMQRLGAINQGIASVEAEMDFRGVADPNVRGLAIKQYTSGVHRDVIDKMLSAVDPDVEMISAYFDAHRDEMLGDDRVKIMADLQKPLQRRADENDFSLAVAGLKPISGSGALTDAPASRSEFMARVRGAESSGDDNARAPTSSATGRYQFTSGTWLSYYKRRFGDTGESEAQILSKRTDGKVQDQLMGDLTADNERALKSAGIETTAGNLYLAHFAGEAGARALHRAKPDASAESVLGRDVIKANPFLRGKSASEVIDWASRKMGGGPATPSAWDKDQVYSQIDKVGDEQGWSLEKRDRLKAMADKRIGEREELLARQEREANDAAFQTIVDLGDRFTSFNQLPKSVRDQLSPEAVVKYREMAEKNLEGAGIPKQGGEATRLEILKRQDPDAFAKVDLQGYIGKVHPDELRSLVLDQASLQGKPQKPDVVRSKINGAISWGQKYGGVKVDDKNFAAVYDTMEGIIRERAGKGTVTDADYDAAFRAATTAAIKTSGGGLFGMGSNVRAPYEITYEMLSDKQKGEAFNLLTAQGIKMPTKGQVLSVARSLMVQN